MQRPRRRRPQALQRRRREVRSRPVWGGTGPGGPPAPATGPRTPSQDRVHLIGEGRRGPIRGARRASSRLLPTRTATSSVSMRLRAGGPREALGRRAAARGSRPRRDRVGGCDRPRSNRRLWVRASMGEPAGPRRSWRRSSPGPRSLVGGQKDALTGFGHRGGDHNAAVTARGGCYYEGDGRPRGGHPEAGTSL